MNNITIDVLFPNGTDNSRYGRLDIDTLFKGTSQLVTKKEDFTSADLLDSIAKTRKKKLHVMIDQYNKCCRMIKEADKEGDDHLTFMVPPTVAECTAYSSVDTLVYIQNNLRKKFIDTTIVDRLSIFITWEDVELKIELEKERIKREKEKRRNDDSSED